MGSRAATEAEVGGEGTREDNEGQVRAEGGSDMYGQKQTALRLMSEGLWAGTQTSRDRTQSRESPLLLALGRSAAASVFARRMGGTWRKPKYKASPASL